jgi:beta-xylosidase
LKQIVLDLAACAICGASLAAAEPQKSAANPIIWADVPDMAMIRVGDTYYVSSTTMHLSPGLPIMKSKDLVDWELASYAYDILDNDDALNLAHGKSAYGGGSFASSLRYHDGSYYLHLAALHGLSPRALQLRHENDRGICGFRFLPYQRQDDRHELKL